MTTSWELIMAARTSWHSSESASGEKRSKEKNGASRFLSLPMSEPPPHGGFYAIKPRIALAFRGSIKDPLRMWVYPFFLLKLVMIR